MKNARFCSVAKKQAHVRFNEQRLNKNNITSIYRYGTRM